MIKQLGDAYFDLLGSEPIVGSDWPFGSLPARYGTIDVDTIRKEISWALYSAGRPVGGRTTLPGPSNAGLGVTGISPVGIAATVAAQTERLVAHLREMPIAVRRHD